MLTAFGILTDGLGTRPICHRRDRLTLIFAGDENPHVTHGSFYAFGAYRSGRARSASTSTRAGRWPGGFLLMVLVAMGIGLVLGLIIERGLLAWSTAATEVVGECWVTLCSDLITSRISDF